MENIRVHIVIKYNSISETVMSRRVVLNVANSVVIEFHGKHMQDNAFGATDLSFLPQLSAMVISLVGFIMTEIRGRYENK